MITWTLAVRQGSNIYYSTITLHEAPGPMMAGLRGVILRWLYETLLNHQPEGFALDLSWGEWSCTELRPIRFENRESEFPVPWYQRFER